MGNLFTTMQLNKSKILSELKNGNTEVLKGLDPAIALSLGVAIQNEVGDFKDPSPINDKELNAAMLERLKDTGIKEQIIKQMEEA
ncbi:hypothetical protein [Terribacillus halophilus]|uniref:hypothetical protein n=1 Tax=Terribacillus halophilus TaxID=361279 RepID=UPI002118ABAA|nr:hypothetical protein [Terribacillus halophilus]